MTTLRIRSALPHFYKFIILAYFLSTPFLSALAAPGINQQIHYQGLLTDSSGNSVTDGSYDIVFKLYDASSSGNLLWTGTHTAANGNAVTVSSGVFSVLLGSGSGNSLASVDFNQDEIWLGITINTDSEMTPRQRMAAASYAFNADKLDGIGLATSTLSTGDLLYFDGLELERLASGTDGQVLKLVSGLPSWGADIFGSGGLFATTSDSLVIHPADTTDVLVLGGSATTTTGNIFEVIGSSLLGGDLVVTGQTTLGNASSTNQTISGYLDVSGQTTLVNASTTNLTASGYINVTGNTTLTNATSTSLYTSTFGVGSEYFTDLTGSGLSLSSGALTVATSTFDLDPSVINLTQGHILIGDASGNASATSTIFVNTSNGNVGIGTTTPGSLLTVVGTSTFAGDVLPDIDNIRNLGSASLRWKELFVGPGTIHLGTEGNFGSFGYSTTSDYLIFDPDGDSTHEVVFTDSGYVGIGTTSPEQHLTISGDGSQRILVQSNTGQAGIEIRGNNGNGQMLYQPTGSNDLRIWDGDQDTITFTDEGKVGIGTSTPESALHIQHSDSLGTQVYLQPKDENDRAIVGFYENDGSPLYTVGAREDSGNLFFSSGNLDPTSDTTPTLVLTSAEDVGIGMTNLNARLTVRASSTNDILNLFDTVGTEVFTVLENGNVGIGTSSPSTALELGGVSNEKDLTVHGDIFVGKVSNDDQFNISNIGNADTSLRYLQIVNSDNIGSFSGIALTRTGVGIGTTSPSSLLEVSAGTDGDAVLTLEADTDGNNDSDNPLILFKQDGGASTGFVGLEGNAGTRSTDTLNNAVIVGSENNNSLQFITNDIARLTVANDGNVGIGTTSPSAKLSVAGETVASHFTATTTATSTFPTLSVTGNLYDANGTGGSNGEILQSTGSGIEWVATSTLGLGSDTFLGLNDTISSYTSNRVLFQSGSGVTDSANLIFDGTNLGIGTTSPFATLSVVGNVYATGNIEAAGRIDGSNFINHETDTSVYVGIDAGTSTAVSSSNNTALGDQALMSINGGDRNTAVGFAALNSLTTGSSNTAIGRTALENLTTSNENIGIGFSALNQLSTGAQNTAIGGGAMFSGSTGADNVALGYHALYANTDGASNVAIGKLAGRFLQDGTTAATSPDQSVLIGADTEFEAATNTNSIVIGYGAEGQGSNTVVLGNDSIVNTFLKGNVSISTTTTAATELIRGQGTRQVSAFYGDVSGDGVYSAWYDNAQEARVLLGVDGIGFASAEKKGVLGTWTNSDMAIFANQAERARFGTTTANALDVNGDVFVGTGTTGCVKDNDGTVLSGTCSSDERLKTSILSAPSVLDRIEQLDFFTYQWNDIAQSLYGYGTEATQYGIIADQAEEVFPELVYEDEKGYKTFDYTRLMLYTVQSVKELYAKIEDIYVKITRNTNKIDELEQKNIQLEQRIKDPEAAMFMGGVHTDRLCIGETCVSEDELKALLSAENTESASDNNETDNEQHHDDQTEVQNTTEDTPDADDQTAGETPTQPDTEPGVIDHGETGIGTETEEESTGNNTTEDGSDEASTGESDELDIEESAVVADTDGEQDEGVEAEASTDETPSEDHV